MTAEKIKALREARGWTQAELARRMNITRNGVNSWEQGLSMPSPACLVDLAKLFSVSTDYLLGVERLETVNVTGLNESDIALLAQLADRLRENHGYPNLRHLIEQLHTDRISLGSEWMNRRRCAESVVQRNRAYIGRAINCDTCRFGRIGAEDTAQVLISV